MDEWIVRVVEMTPNMVVALLVLYWQRRTIDALLAHQQQLLDRLLTLIERVQILADTAAAAAAKPPQKTVISS